MTDKEEPYVTKTGKVLSDQEIEDLADEAEQGYDVSRLTARSLVGYERRLHKMRYVELLTEAQRVGAQVFKDITRPILIARILEVQGINDDILKGDPPK
jgi:hypothetical protein